MTQATERRDGIVSSRSCLIAILTALLVFPPSLFSDPISWTAGGDGSTYGDVNNWNPGVVPNNGGGVGYDVSIQSSGGNSVSVEQGIDAVTVDSMSIRGGHVASTATLSVGGGGSLTIGTPNTQGNALYVGNRGTLNAGDPTSISAGNVTLDLSAGGGSLPPGAPNSVGAYIASGGSVNVTGNGFFQQGSAFTVQNSSGGTRAITNNGSIKVGADGSFSTLQFSNQGTPGNFVLTGSGSVTLAGAGAIVGTTGTENLTNDFGHTINANGFNSIGGGGFAGGAGLGSFTNNGTLSVSGTAFFGEPSELIVGAPLTNYNTVTGKLTNGTYNVQNGGTLALLSVGLGNSMGSLNLVNMQLSGSGAQIVGGFNEENQGSSSQGPNLRSSSLGIGGQASAIGSLTHLTDSNLDLQGIKTTITPSNYSGTLTLRSDPLGIPTNLTVEQDPIGNSSNLEIAGNVKNVSSVYGAPQQSPSQTFGAVSGNPGTTISLGGSSINVSGSTLTVDNNLSNQAYGTSFWGGAPSTQQAFSNINVMNGGTLNVGGNLTSHTNYNGNSSIGITGYDDQLNPTGGTINVTGNLRNGGGFGSPMSSGVDVVALANGTLNVGGNFTNNNSGNGSLVYVDGNSKVSVTGWFGQFQGNSGNGESELYVNGGQMTVGNLRNSTGAFGADTANFQPQSLITIDQGGSLTIGNKFANIDSNGVLTGGGYSIGGGSTLNYATNGGGVNITKIGANTSLALDDGETGITGQILNNGNDAISSSLNEVAGSLTLLNGAGLNLTSAQGLTIDSSGQVALIGYGSLAANSLQNNGSLALYAPTNSVNVTTLGNLSGGILSGGNWNLSGGVNFGAGSDTTSTTITGLDNAIVNLNGLNAGFFNNGNDALVTLNSIANGSQLGIASQTRSFGPLTIDGTGSSQTILSLSQGANVTFNGPSGSSGAGLSMTGGNAIMNVDQSTATLNLANGNTASIANGATLSINDGSTLALTGGTSGSPGVVALNGGTLNVQGWSAAGVLSVADGGAYQITSDPTNGGQVLLNGLGQVNVSNGNLAFGAGALSNLSGGMLTGGTYIVGNSGTLQLADLSVGGTLSTVSGGATVSVSGNGLLTHDGSNNALLGLTEIDDSSTVSLRSAGNITITPGTSGAGANTFYLNNSVDTFSGPSLNLRSGTNVQLAGNFQSFGGNLNITNGSSLAIGGSFNNVDGSGNLGGNNLPINLTVGSNSSLTYTGADIASIASGSMLTLGNREGGTTGTIQNLSGSQHDALSSSLNTVSGTLNLQNGAQLTLQAAAVSFQNNGNVNLTNGSTLDVSNVALGNVDGSGNLTGNFLIGSGSVLNYAGASSITNIDGNLTLDNSNGGTTGRITNGIGNDAISGSLTSVGANNFEATLALQNGAGLTLTGTSFQNFGNVSITNGSTLDVSALGSNFKDVDGSGNMSGNYLIGTGSALNYSGTNITTINGQLTLDNSSFSATGGVTNGGQGNDALSNSLTTINGTLNLQNSAFVELNNGQQVTNNWGHTRTVYTPLTLNPGAQLNIDANGGGQGGSVLTVDGKLVSYNAQISLGPSLNLGGGGPFSPNSPNAQSSELIAVRGLANKSDDNNSDSFGSSIVTVNGSNLLVGGLDPKSNAVTNVSNLFNGSFTPNGGTSSSEIVLTNGAGGRVTGNVTNLALFGTLEGNGPSSATIKLYGESELTVDGNVKNIAAQGDYQNQWNAGSVASINLHSGSDLKVGGTFTNDSGAFSGVASLNLKNSTAEISGLFTNSGGSLVTLKGYEDDSGFNSSTLTAQAGFNNYNSTVLLKGSSALNVMGGFQNLSDDSNNSQGQGYSLLAIGSRNSEGEGPTSVATITGGLVNSASTSNGGSAESKIVVNGGSTLNVDNLTNSAMVATSGLPDPAEAKLILAGGNLNVTGNLSNSTSIPTFPSGSAGGYASAKILSWDGSITVGGSFTNTNAQVYLSDTSLKSSNGILNSATDTNFNPNAPAQLSGFSHMKIDNGSNAWVYGGLTNSAVSGMGGLTAATFKVDGGSSMTVSVPGSDSGYAFTNLASILPTSGPGGPVGQAYARTTITGGSSLTVDGNLLNMSSAPGFPTNQTGAFINVECFSTLTVNGTFNNTAGTLNVSGGSTANVMGAFANDSNSSVNLTGIQNIQPPSPPQQGPNVNTSSSDSITTLNVTGEFDNYGSVSIGSGTALNVLEDGNSDPSTYSQTEGTTTLSVGGILSADNVNITGGTMQGYNDGSGLTSATVYGNLTIGSDGSEGQGLQTATLDLGDPMSIDVVGNYDQTMLGILDLSLDGVGLGNGSDDSNNAYDQLDVTGNVLALDGALVLNLESAFYTAVTAGEVFNILDWTGTNGSTNSCAGSADIGCFGTFNDVTFADSQILGQIDTFVERVNSNANGQELDLVVEGISASATPEPGTLSMLFCAMLIGGGVTWYRRRRKNLAA